MSVPLLTLAPDAPVPGPSPSPSCSPTGSSCQVTTQALPLPRFTSCLASRQPSDSCWAGCQVVPPSLERAIQVQENGISRSSRSR